MVIVEAAAVAAANLLGKVSYDVWKRWFDGDDQAAGVAFDSSGGFHSLQHLNGGQVYLTDPGFFGWVEVEPTDVIGYFVPADEQAADWLDPDQPVLCTILDTDPDSELEGFVVPGYLDEPFVAAFYPGVYTLVAFVFLDEDVDMLDGIGIGEFSVEWGEPAFSLEIPVIDADELEIEELLDDLLA